MFECVDDTDIEDDEDLYLDSDFVDPDAEAVPAIDLSLAPGARLALQIQCAGAVPELLSRGRILAISRSSTTGRRYKWMRVIRGRLLTRWSVSLATPCFARNSTANSKNTSISSISRLLASGS